MSTAAVPDHKQDVKDVMATTEKWIKTVTGQKPTSPAETAALYAKVGPSVLVMWGVRWGDGPIDRSMHGSIDRSTTTDVCYHSISLPTHRTACSGRRSPPSCA